MGVTEGKSGMGMSKHRKSGHTFKGRRAKMEMEREANKPKKSRPKPEFKEQIKDLFKFNENCHGCGFDAHYCECGR